MRLPGMTTSRLERRLFLERAWQRYVEEGTEPVGVSEDITQSWRRARDAYRIDPGITRPSRGLSAEELEERCDRDEVFRLATSILGDFSARLASAEHVLAYLDGDGWMLSIDGDRRIIERVENIDFRPGTNWSEESAGTNGPGTALAAGKAVEVFASEHFVQAWQPWSCAAAPIRAPGEATAVGLIDITGPWQVQRRQAILVAKAIARAVEERLRAAVSVRDEVVRHAFRAAHEMGDALGAVDARGHVIAANDAAARRRLVDAGSLPLPLREALTGALRSRSPAGDGELRLEPVEGPPVVASTVNYEGSTVGALLRVTAGATGARAPRARGGPSARYDFGRILGKSEALQRPVELAKTSARNDLP